MNPVPILLSARSCDKLAEVVIDHPKHCKVGFLYTSVTPIHSQFTMFRSSECVPPWRNYILHVCLQALQLTNWAAIMLYCVYFLVNSIINSRSIMASWACFFFSPLFFTYSYTFCTYPEMRAAVWLLGGAYGCSSNLYWVMPPTLCTCSYHRMHAHAHTCTHTQSYTYAHSCMYGQTVLSWLSLLATGTGNRNAYNCVYFAGMEPV